LSTPEKIETKISKISIHMLRKKFGLYEAVTISLTIISDSSSLENFSILSGNL